MQTMRFPLSVRHTAIVIGFLMLGLSGPANAQCAGFPHYPPESKAANEQGTVTVSVRIGVDGSVLESLVAQSSGYPRLDELARSFMAQCKFKPATVDGKPQETIRLLKYTWRLED